MPPLSYDLLVQQTMELVNPEWPLVTNLSNMAALLFHSFQQADRPINWAGFYLVKPLLQQNSTLEAQPALYLGPFQGQIACTLIPFGKGVCGSSLKQKTSLLVPDVHQFPGHIACDSQSESELVVPLMWGGKAIGVIDMDCLVKNGFTIQDQEGIERIAACIIESMKDSISTLVNQV